MIKARSRQRSPAQQFNAVTDSLPAPVGGWNARDSLADMPEEDAVELVNWFPSTTDVMVRKGYEQHATGLPSYVDTLMVYNSPTASKMFAGSGTAIYDATTSGAVGAAAVSGLTNVRFQYINFATAGGNFLNAVNGADKLRGYDGTNWWIDGDGSHDITGVNTNTWIHINVFKRRIWGVEKNSLKVWYLPVDSIAGAAQSINFQSLASKGGYLMAMATWTIDSGTGADDHAVFITSQGQIIVYRGIDPSNEVTWSLVGVYDVGSPFVRRCFHKLGGDLLIVTYDGLFALSSYLQSDRVMVAKRAITDKIRNAMSEAVSLYNANYGWEIAVYPEGDLILLNVPTVEGANQEQYVQNALTGSWCNFTGWDANCFAIFNNRLYFGGNMFVGKAWSTFADNQTAIDTMAKQAFNYFKSRGQIKRYTMGRPMILTDGAPSILCGVNTDFGDEPLSSTLSFVPNPYGKWDSALWDSGLWGGGVSVLKNWQGITGTGYCASIVLQSQTQDIETRWVATDICFEPGSVL